MASPELMQPSTNSKATFSRQLGEKPNLDSAREVFRRSHEKIIALRAPIYQAQALPRSTIAVFTERSIFEQRLVQNQDEIERLSKELATEKQQNAELKAKLLEAEALPATKRKRSGGKLPAELDRKDCGLL
jgi:septal ring factor EnvC (AmiA/AmiB activator)